MGMAEIRVSGYSALRGYTVIHNYHMKISSFYIDGGETEKICFIA